MTLAAKNHIAFDLFGNVRYERVHRVMIGLALSLSLASCNQLVGFKDVQLEGDGGNGSGSDAGPRDAPIDMGVDAPPAKLFAFITDASFIGGFGSAIGQQRTIADAKCQDKYTLSFQALGCTEIHAVIEIDDNIDTIARMKIKFPTLPQTSEVKRATDMTTPLINNWDAFVNPNVQLQAPIAPQAGPIFFWSGRSAGGNLSCNHWTASVASMSGNAGDATKTNSWMTQANITCDNFDQHLVCVCW